jgi:hypothetical protein
MRRSLGIISGAFALRSRAFALVGHVVFLFQGRAASVRRLRLTPANSTGDLTGRLGSIAVEIRLEMNFS